MGFPKISANSACKFDIFYKLNLSYFEYGSRILTVLVIGRNNVGLAVPTCLIVDLWFCTSTMFFSSGGDFSGMTIMLIIF